MGRKVFEKKNGKNYMVRTYYFQDGYRNYAYRRLADGDWIESQATSIRIPDLQEAITSARAEIKSIRLLKTLHPVLRDSGHSYSGATWSAKRWHK